jgi:ligand-binding sensor domain-containing protein
MVIDLSQNIWLKMYDGRVFVINRKTYRIEDPLEGISNHDDFHVDYFFQPYVTSTGDVLISYDDIGLYRLRLDRNGLKQDLITTGQLTVNSVVEGYRNDIWAATDKGVHRINMVNMSLERRGYFLNEHITRLATNGYNIFAGTKSGKILQFSYGRDSTLVKDIGREITSLYVDKHGRIWFSDLGDGAYRLDPQTGDVKFYNHRVLAPEFTSRGAEFGEALGVLWIRMNHGGYGYYNRATDEVEYFHNDPSNPWNLSNTVYAALELPEGVVWESTSRRGLEKLELQKDNIVRIRPVANPTYPTENEIRAMLYDTQRKLLLIGNKHSSLFLNYDDGRREVITKDSDGKPLGRFYGISKDSKGNYWLASKDFGIYHMTPTGNGWTLKNYHHEDGNAQSLSHNGAYMAIEDKSGNIWIATYGGGVNLLPREAIGNPTFLSPANGMKDYPKSSHMKVRTIAIDNEGNVWAGTTDGILILSYKNNKVNVEKLKMPEEGNQMLMSNDIVCMKCDAKGTMWLGSNGGGLACTTGKEGDTWLFDNYGAHDGIPSEEIRSITFDQRGNPWFATEHILCSFDIATKVITTFSYLDGVDETVISEGGAVTMGNGDLLFGTLDGYYLVDLKKLMASSGSLLKLQITDFLINGDVQSPRLNKTFDYYVPSRRSVELPDRNKEITFRFASLNYQLQHRVHYQYMLEGYDKDWMNADRERTATYSGLPAGTYTFKVKAYLLESPDQYDIRTMEVIVPSLWLLSTPALIIYGLLLIGLALFIYYRIRSKAAK